MLGDAVANDHVGQAGAAGKHAGNRIPISSDAGDAVGNRHARQVGAARKRIMLDAGDGIAVVGGGNDNVTGSAGLLVT